MRVKIIKYFIMALAVIAGIVWYAVVSNGDEKEELSITMESTSYEAAVSTDDSGGDRIASDSVMGETNDETTEVERVFVYVCGAVVNPGVYELSADARVVNAIDAAGGFGEGAAQEYLNLARAITDGEKIEVPTIAEVEAGLAGSSIIGEEAVQDSSPDSAKLSVNINTATKEELMELPGIGESRALSIIAYREENGYFGSIEEIMLVSGIKEGAFAKIKAYIRVAP